MTDSVTSTVSDMCSTQSSLSNAPTVLETISTPSQLQTPEQRTQSETTSSVHTSINMDSLATELGTGTGTSAPGAALIDLVDFSDFEGKNTDSCMIITVENVFLLQT